MNSINLYHFSLHNSKRQGKNKRWLKVLQRILLILFLIIVIAFLFAYFYYWKEIRTVTSIRQVGNSNFYEMNYASDYKLDEFLKQGATTDEELVNYMMKNTLKGLPIHLDVKHAFSCSTFSIKNDQSESLLGRNFDWPKSTTPVLVHTKPKQGYESLSFCNMNYVGKDCDLNKLSGKVAALILPYIPMDGINEKGLVVAVLALKENPTKQKTGKVGITTTTAIRMMLDQASDVNEAINLLQQYDMYSSAGYAYHFMVADSNGNSAVIEYVNGEMKVFRKNEAYQVCTNFKLADYSGKKITKNICDRYVEYQERLGEANGVMTNDGAF